MAHLAETIDGYCDGLVCYFGETAWQNARFTIVSNVEGGAVVVTRSEDGLTDVRRIELVSITNLDEITEGMDAPELAEFHRIEVSVERAVCCQIIWPKSFTPTLLNALERTVQPPQHA